MELPNDVFGVGINRFSQAELARRSGIDQRNLNAAIAGKRGLSLKSAQAISEQLGTKKPLSLYIQSQSQAIKARTEAGDRSAALRAAASVAEELAKLSPDQLTHEGPELANAVNELRRLLGEVFDGATGPDSTQTATKSAESTRVARDAFGRRTPETSATSRDPHGRKIRDNA